MSETSQSVGRIAVLTAFTLLFAAAWRSDAPQPVRPSQVLASIRRQSGAVLETAVRGAIADGLIAARPLTARDNGRLLAQTPIRETPAPKSPALFSGTPALLGRSTPALPAANDTLTTASSTPHAAR